MAQDKAASALNRFGLGARPGERQRIGEPRDWLLAQLRPESIPAAFQSLPDSRD